MISVFCSLLALGTAAVGFLPDEAKSAQASSQSQEASDSEIRSLISALSEPDYARRVRATRRLCAIGMPARSLLIETVKGPDAEAALRAQSVLKVLDALMFAGVDIQLTMSDSRFSWDTPVDLIIELHNRSEYPARIPFAAPSTVENDEMQVGTMLDVAEVLVVRGADGHEINLTVDDIASNQDASRAIRLRLDHDPIHVVNPGETATYRIRAFNRGWARYRLLDSGSYTLQIVYTPAWSDEILAEQHLGRVVSNTARVIVTAAAPKQVSRAGSEAAVHVQTEGDGFVARLTNRTDQVLFINQHFGSAPPFADGRWVCEFDDSRRDVSLLGHGTTSLTDFDLSQLTPVRPGTSIDLARITMEHLRQGLKERGAFPDTQPWNLHFAYMNLFNAKWQATNLKAIDQSQEVPALLRKPIPMRVLTGRHTSNQITTMPDASGRNAPSKPEKKDERTVPAG